MDHRDYRQGRKDDFRNLVLIAVSALAGVALTVNSARMSGPFGRSGPPPHAEHSWYNLTSPAPKLVHYPWTVTYLSPSERATVRLHRGRAKTVVIPGGELVDPLSGSNRLFGTVETKNGAVHRGFLRWDRNEGSWGDVLDASKATGSLSGVRFGHIERIHADRRNEAVLTLRSGRAIRMRGRSTDLGAGLRSVVIDQPAGDPRELEWREIEAVHFSAPLPGLTPRGVRLHGTVTTASAMTFTGHITWDMDEIHASDVLDGDLDGTRYEIAFGAIRTIQRLGPRSALARLHRGDEFVLSGTNDVNRENRGIVVSDASLGQVVVPWSEFGDVRFHGSDSEESWEDFDGGEALRGSVTTVSGETVVGDIRWDSDERATWELLNGEALGVEFAIEFSRIAKIEKRGSGSLVTLRDGRAFALSGSNDVARGNRGIVVMSGNQVFTVPWRDFVALELSP